MSHAIICDILSALMRGNRTMESLSEMCLGGDSGQRGAINALRDAGLVRINKYDDSPLGGRKMPVFELQKAPFLLDDAPLREDQILSRKKYARKLARRAAE